MKDLLILIGSRMINGVIGLVFFAMLKMQIADGQYGVFSFGLAQLTLLTTLGGGVLSGLLLKNAFDLHGIYRQVLFAYLGLFAVLLILPVEGFLWGDLLPGLSRGSVYVYVGTHLLTSVVLVHYQLKRQFLLMGGLEILRNLLPLVLLYLVAENRMTGPVSPDMAILFLSWGQVPAILLFVFLLTINPGAAPPQPWRNYFRSRAGSDLGFGLSFSGFNALAQWVMAKDRQLILELPDPKTGSDIAYSADQMTKVSNGVLFPFNTKISAGLGNWVRQGEHQTFYKQLHWYSALTLSAGALLTLLAALLVWQFGDRYLIRELHSPAIWQYGVANTLYLSALIYQKRFDYTRYKVVPLLMLALAAVCSTLIVTFVSAEVSFFLVTVLCYAGFLILASIVLPSNKTGLYST